MSLVPIDPSSAVAVTSYLEQAKTWLSTAVETSSPEQVAAAKAELATAAEATKQLGLSKEIQFDAIEMVRLAEYTLGRAIRKGQAEGTVATRGQRPSSAASGELRRVADFGTDNTMYGTTGNGGTGVLALADEVPDPADFDAALAEAKAEGNLSRANVARKAQGISGKPRKTPRRPINESLRHAGLDLITAVERIERLLDDDRYGSEAEQVAPILRNHLNQAIESCQGLLERVNNN